MHNNCMISLITKVCHPLCPNHFHYLEIVRSAGCTQSVNTALYMYYSLPHKSHTAKMLSLHMYPMPTMMLTKCIGFCKNAICYSEICISRNPCISCDHFGRQCDVSDSHAQASFSNSSWCPKARVSETSHSSYSLLNTHYQHIHL